MAVGIVRMPYIVYLKAERVLQVVARLFVRQTRHDGCPFSDVDDSEATGFWERTGDLMNLLQRRHLMRVSAEVELRERADVADFTNTDMAVVVGQSMNLRHCT